VATGAKRFSMTTMTVGFSYPWSRVAGGWSLLDYLGYH
jgi:hypothetical protein